MAEVRLSTDNVQQVSWAIVDERFTEDDLRDGDILIVHGGMRLVTIPPGGKPIHLFTSRVASEVLTDIKKIPSGTRVIRVRGGQLGQQGTVYITRDAATGQWTSVYMVGNHWFLRARVQGAVRVFIPFGAILYSWNHTAYVDRLYKAAIKQLSGKQLDVKTGPADPADDEDDDEDEDEDDLTDDDDDGLALAPIANEDE